ncbi:MAG: ABC transporter ATP-binding protein, partial [Burkholderiales bacterium]|nr:ABC transporter ATP-binding protein [Burkholderiales bacterium]
GGVLEVALGRPRDRLALATHPRYIEYRREVLEFLYQRQAKVAA